VVLRILPIPTDFIHHLDILGHIGVEVVLNDLLHSVICVEFEEQHKVDVVSPSGVQYRNILNADDCRHSLVASNTQHTEDLLIKLHTRDHIIKDGQELVFVASVFIDILHVLEDFGEILGRLGQVLHRLVDVCLWRVRHQDTDMLLEIMLEDVGQGEGLA